MKVVKKLIAPVLVVGLLMTSLLTLHHLKTSKHQKIKIGISQYITHKSLDATRKGFVEELAKQGYVDGEEIEIDYQCRKVISKKAKHRSKPPFAKFTRKQES